MAAVPRRLPMPSPVHALGPALGSGGMKVGAKFFVLFPAKISYAGGQDADSRVQKTPSARSPSCRHAEHLPGQVERGGSASLYCSCRLWRDPETNPIAIGSGGWTNELYLLVCHPERSRRTFITPIHDPSLRSRVVRAEACLLQAGNLFRRIFPIP
ncbi:hypothetical protein SAMN04488024_1063 [Pedobacter soli]|uniref:Uncharacterized protein n=1 Tax=Pedobacter soli TaxID=390242 RepID=A0A1G6V5T6_9SPHI|nr:hypothetical protein SAMN04488024_1063 [Pedobacter soli]